MAFRSTAAAARCSRPTRSASRALGSIRSATWGSGIVLTNHTGATLTFNLVGYNTGDGLRIVGGGGHLLHGMQVGLKIDGMSAAPNGGNGLTIDASANNVVGEPVASQGNSFSGNLGHGVVIRQAGSTGNTLRNNLIGANLAGTGPVGNSGWYLLDGASNNTIGGNAAVDGNLVAYNGTGGIAVLSGTGNAIRVNRLRSNGGIGIDLDADGALPADGPTANDSLDADTGGNRRQNYPVLTSSTAAAFSGVLKSTPNTTHTLDGYSSASADPSGFGEVKSGSERPP